MKNKILSVTQKNALIDAIATDIQLARISMRLDNNCTFREADNMVRVLCLVLFLKRRLLGLNDLIDLLKVEEARELIEYYSLNECKEIKHASEYLQKIIDIPAWRELLLYAFEAFEYDPNKFINSEVKKRIHNIDGKKGGGIFYTPQDVVKYMTDECDNKMLWSERNFLDCSCGTGAFLVEIMRRICAEKNSPKAAMEAIKYCVWGIDISKNAVENCKIILLMYFMEFVKIDKNDIGIMQRILDNNIVQGNSLELYNVISSKNMPEKYSCIIGNPPYVSMNSIGNTFIPFVHNIINYSSDNSCSSLVVPLSISTSKLKPYVLLREKIQEDFANWKIINFDRSPDSLFGDHVKTRNAILVRNNCNNDKSIYVSGLIRWAADSRVNLFNKIQVTNIKDLSIRAFIPKLSADFERDLLVVLLKKRQKIIENLDKNNNVAMYVNATAYNWISVFDHIPESKDKEGNLYVPHSLMKLFFSTEQDVYFFIAMLSNRVTYWLWTLSGDGFHVNKEFILNLPYGKLNYSKDFYNKVAYLGMKYVNRLKKYPRKSYNCGKEIINYDHFNCFDIIEKIEIEIIKELGAKLETIKMIGQWYKNHIKCGRGRDIYGNFARNKRSIETYE